MHLELIPQARREILRLLKRRGPLPVEEIAGALQVTVSGARQHLASLERDGVVTYQRLRQGPGRPRHLYQLTESGDSLFPRRYAELANELLSYVRESDPVLVDRIFARRSQRRLDAVRGRLEGLDFESRVRALASFLDEEGYYACVEADDGTFRIIERNCAVKAVAERFRQACNSELSFLRKALPDAEVRRTSHVLNTGQHCCAYEIRRTAREPGGGVGVDE